MTVAELITALQSLDPHLPVFTRDGENGNHLIIHITPNYTTECCGLPAVLLLGRYEASTIQKGKL
jgi:hypothetical protein